jgi:integrase
MVNRANYLWVKDFLRYLEETLGLSEKSVSRYWFHLRHLLVWADETLLPYAPRIHPVFQAYVMDLPGKSGRLQLSDETQSRIVETARRFFEWAKIHSYEDFRMTKSSWIDTLRPRKTRAQQSDHEFVTLEEVQQLVNIRIPCNNLALLRDRAAATMLFLSGMRASAFASAPIKAFDLEKGCVYQWPKEMGVDTKNGKRATTYLLPIPKLLKVVKEWDRYVRIALPLTSPWYAPIKNEWGEHQLSMKEPGKNRNLALNKRLRLLFQVAGLEYKSAHKFRHGHAVYGLQHAITMADYKAVSLNLMHEDIRTTDSIYACLVTDEVKTRIAGLQPSENIEPSNQLEMYFQKLSDDELALAVRIASERLAV